MDHAAAEAILQRLPLISEQQTAMLHAMWQGGDVTIRQRAWKRGRRALSAQHAEALWERASGAVGRWVRDHATGRVGQPYEVYASFTDQNRLDMRVAAAPPILDALLGSLVAEVFPEDELDELMAPWTLAMDTDPSEGTDPADAADPSPDTRGDTHP